MKIDSNGSATAYVKALISANLFQKSDQADSRNGSLAMAAARNQLSSQTTVDKTSTVTSHFGNISVLADGSVDDEPWAEPRVFQDGVAGVGIGVTVDMAVSSLVRW